MSDSISVSADTRVEPSLGQMLRSMASLLASYALLMAGTGLFGTFVVLRAGHEGMSNDLIGLQAAAYYAGLVIGTLRCGPLVNRVGHIRAFAAFSSVIASIVLAFPFLTDAYLWMLLRALIGFNVAGVFLVAESWLNHKATPSTRGTLLSMYMMTSYIALGGGQALINAGPIEAQDLFMLAAMLFGLAVLPVAITRATHPPPVSSPHLDLRLLLRTSPVATLSCVFSGLSVGALWSLGPLFAQGLGMSVAEISRFMGIIILSALLFQFPIGRLSDRLDRRHVILAVNVAATLFSGALVAQLYLANYGTPWDIGGTTAWLRNPLIITTLAALYGGVVSTLYPLGVAYANDYTRPENMVAVSAGLVLAYGVGAAVGPIPAGALMNWAGPSGLFMYNAAVALGLVGFIVYRMTRPPRDRTVHKEAFVALPEATSTPTPLEADPRVLVAAPEVESRPRWMWILDRRRRRR